MSGGGVVLDEKPVGLRTLSLQLRQQLFELVEGVVERQNLLLVEFVDVVLHLVLTA